MQPPSVNELNHIPAVPQKPLVGNTLDIIKNPSGLHNIFLRRGWVTCTASTF